MSYTRKNGAVAALGGTWDDALSVVKNMSGSVDPYLPEVLCRVDQIRALRKDRSVLQMLTGKAPTVAVPNCSTTAPGLPGIGVEEAVAPLRAYVYMNQNPWIVWLGITAALMVPFLLGYSAGKGSK